MKYFTILVFFLSLSSFSVETEPCDCNEAAEKMENAETANGMLIAYADFQLFQLRSASSAFKGFLSSGHATGATQEKYQQAQWKVEEGEAIIKKKIAAIKKTKISSPKIYSAELKSIHAIGTRAISEAYDMVGITKDGKYIVTMKGEAETIDPICVDVYTDMKQACLRGLQTMADCGIYQVLGLEALKRDQENCSSKAGQVMEMCVRVGAGNYDHYREMEMEQLMADQACEEHAKLVGGGNPAQYESWDGF